MGIGPYRPLDEIEHAITRGDLGMARAIAKDFAAEHGRPIPLAHALKFLPLVAAQHFDDYDAWASHWLERWLKEMPGPKLEHAADIAAALAELPLEPTDALDVLLPACTSKARRTS